MEYVSIVGCLITAILGLSAIVLPAKIAEFVSVHPIGNIGLSEIRATYGGLFLAMAVIALISRSEEALLVLGIGWVGAGAVRLITMFFQKFDYRNLGGVLMEATIGLIVAAKALF